MIYYTIYKNENKYEKKEKELINELISLN